LEKKIYQGINHFNGLNGLRFIAAFLVVMHHSETIRQKYGLLNLEDFSLFRNGFNAVSFFFVLSGFLITYLLMKEHSKTGTISVRHFYIRRILRIWPLYFFLVVIGTVVVPLLLHAVGYDYQMPYNFGQVWFYFLFFMPFMVNILFGHHLIEPLWSIGVEELFYLFWAPFSKYTQKLYLFFIFLIIVVKVVISILCITVWKEHVALRNLFSMLQFEAMAIGALGAYWVYRRENEVSKNVFFSRPLQVVLLLMLVARLAFHDFLSGNGITKWIYDPLFNVPVFSTLLVYCLFLWLVINVSLNSKRLFGLENKVMEMLGDISYGIYMYHMLVIFALILVGKSFLMKFNIATASLIYYPIVGGGVIFISWLSKKYFENWFLDLKSKFF
jgi:peptidoglycan/LPS O-acetylase OafA/YrhL